ncbi:putative duf500 domain protein [Neofusicoccum parvum UCRNP2]|uniref:Putative duf500 domain protein n=1 Tax=Botryosphaeria parva (strain UCR-NP2) TaxID=1287680 RepID=R1GUP9_BOTPV|nr:putative duf500 domain protein [Neofusicoccum parvum UCRNP2]
MWQRTKHGSKTGFDKLWGWADKLGAPVNRLSNRLGSEAFWPTTLDKESDKAARILRSFCKDGFYEEEVLSTLDGPQQKQKVLKNIPSEVIRNAVGLAIFTTMRSGLWVSGAGGSGILVGRTEDGSWSPPSGIMLHTAGLGFLVGVDIYDCVVVINTEAALEAFSKTVDMGIQTDFDSPGTNSRRLSEAENRSPMAEIPENDVAPTAPSRSASVAASMKSIKEEVKEDCKEAEKEQEQSQHVSEDAEEKQTEEIQVKLAIEDDEKSYPAAKPEVEEDNDKSETSASAQTPNFARFSTYDYENVAVEEPVVHQVRQAATPQAMRARLVSVKKPTPPRIPPRNPVRNRRGPLIISAEPYNADVSRDSMSPRSPPSSSEHPSISTMDSASTVSSRDSFSSDDGIDAMNKRISVIRMTDSDETPGKQEKNSRKNSDEFHSVPATPGQQAKSPIEEDFS